MEAVKIVGFCVLAACVYGILHNLVTARVCIEYFTEAHPVLIPWPHPVALAVFWGIVATWWVGAGLGAALALAARVGQRPKLSFRTLVKPIVLMLAALYALAMIAGLIGYAAGTAGWVWLLPPWSRMIAPERHARFLFDLWAHSASYGLGALGVAALAVWVFRRRGAMAHGQRGT